MGMTEGELRKVEASVRESEHYYFSKRSFYWLSDLEQQLWHAEVIDMRTGSPFVINSWDEWVALREDRAKVVGGEPLGYDEEGRPILAAWLRQDIPYGWRVWCRYCVRWHLHGNCGVGSQRRIWSRVAHCDRPLKWQGRRREPVYSPYSETEYVLQPARKEFVKIENAGYKRFREEEKERRRKIRLVSPAS